MNTNPPLFTLRWLFFGFSGRIARKSFALAVLLQLTLLTLLIYQAVQAGDNEERLIAVGLAMMALMVFLGWSIIALSIKRLHDVNLPAVLSILLFIPAINWAAFLYLMLKSSHPETNEHGPPPFSR